MTTIGTLVAHLGVDGDAFDRGVDKAKDKLSSLNGVAAGVGKALAITGAGIAGIGASVQLVGGLVGVLGAVGGALPVLAAGAAAAKFGMVGLGLAMDGFGDAMSSMDDPAAFAEAIAELSPAARSAAIAVRDMAPAWDAMKDRLQERLFAGVASEISSLGGTYMPILEGGFGRIASAGNEAGLAVGEMMRESSSIKDVTSMTGDFASAWENVLPAVAPLGGVLLDVGKVAADFLPGMTGGATGAARAFASMVSEMRNSGELHMMMQRGLDALSKLGEVAGNVGEILGGIWRAADQGGAGFLERLVIITQQIADMVNSVDGQEALGTFFATAAELSGLFMEALRVLLPVLPPLVDALGTLAVNIGTMLVDALTAIAPYLESFATWMSENPGLVMGLVIAFGALLAAANLLMGIVGIINMVGAIVASGALGMIASAASAAAGWVVSWAMMAASALASAASMALAWLIPILPIALLIAAIAGLVALVVIYWDEIVAWTQQAWNNVVQFLTDAGNNIVSTVDGWAAAVGQFIRDTWNNAVQSTRDGWNNAVAAVQTGVAAVVNWVRGLPGQILGILGGIGSQLAASGRAIVDDFLRGIQAGWNRLMGWVQQGMAALRGLWPFSPAKFGPFSGSGYVTHSGAALTGDFAKSLRAGMPGVIASARELMAAAHIEMAPPALSRPPASAGLPGDAWMPGASPATAAARGGDRQVITTVNIHNPKAERGSDSFARDMADLSEMGAFS